MIGEIQLGSNMSENVKNLLRSAAEMEQRERQKYDREIRDPNKFSRREKKMAKNRFEVKKPVVPHYRGKMDTIADRMVATEF